jgi:N-acetylglucosaminyldiphosphoundecaprenol N-acetyl-beta-D-mannosaminyltransferase
MKNFPGPGRFRPGGTAMTFTPRTVFQLQRTEDVMRANFLGSPIDLLTFDQTIAAAIEAMLTRKQIQHVAINVAKLVKMRRDPELRRDVTESDIIGVDGAGIVWGARALGIKVPERVAGIDLMERLLALCSVQNFRPYLLGTRRSVLEKAVENAHRHWPGLTLAGYRDGYFSESEEHGIVEDIRSTAPDCLFIALPTPRKERFVHRYRDTIGVPFVMGVGGSFDILAGEVSRAPRPMQNAGLEWLYRVYQEPKRMWWRYFSTNAVYAGLIGRELIARTVRGTIFPSNTKRAS